VTVADAVPRATLDFLAELRENNNRDWFDAHRSRYEECVLAPAKELVSGLAPRLERLAPGIRAEPRVLGSIFRINRDTRFSPDKRPYKDHLDLWFWHGARATAVSGLFLRLTPESVVIGAGAHGLAKAQLQRFRDAVCDPRAGLELRDIAEGLESAGIGIHGRELTRPPRGHVAPPDVEPFLLHRALFVAVTEPAEFATEPGLLDRLERRWRPLAPVHRWLVDHVQDTATAR
jgi:uncharacterized protein (TIGR02453 family)